MNEINYTILPKSLVVNYDGKTLTIARDDHRFTKVIKAIKAGDFVAARSIAENDFSFGEDFKVENGELYYQGEKLPRSLGDRVLAFAKDDLPFESLIKFFKKLKQNPSYNSREMLYKFLEHNGHPITPEGNFIAYRGVTADFKDLHTRTFDNSVGSICEMDRNAVDDNPNNTCSAGLHVACHDYANGFGPQLIEVEVNPVDVVCVPTDYNGTKMRVSKFKVLNVCEQERDETIYNQERSFDGDSLIGAAVKCKWGEYGTIEEYDDELDIYKIRYNDDAADWVDQDSFEVL
jgi:hypothetical protein